MLWGRKAQDHAHAGLEELAKETGAEMTRGMHPFDLVVGENAIDFVVVLPEELYEGGSLESIW